MALFNCPECGRSISDKAQSCPNCGYVILRPNNAPIQSVLSGDERRRMIASKRRAKQRRKERNTIIAIIISTLVIVCVIVGYFVLRISDSEKLQIQAMTEKINSIGDISLDSAESLTEIEMEYQQLSPKIKFHIKNKESLLEAMATYNQLCADVVIEKIENLGGISLTSTDALKEVAEQYNNLSDDQKKLVKNYSTLQEAERTLSRLQVENVMNKIEEIGYVTIESKASIEIARNAYDSLSPDDKDTVSNYSKLTSSEDEYNQALENSIINAIDNIGSVSLDRVAEIKRIREQYDSLPEEQKNAINNIDHLISAENTLYQLEIKEVIDGISRIGDVSLESNDLISKIEKSYNALSSDQQKAITNYTLLTEAKNKYDALVKEKKEQDMTIEPGETITAGKWKYTFNKVRLSAKIYPNDTGGWYMYYHCDDDETFVDMVFTVRNIDTDIRKLENFISDVKVIYNNDYNYTLYNLYHSEGDDVDPVYSWDGLDALDSTTLHVAVTIPREAQNNEYPIKIYLTIAGERRIINYR